MMKYGLSDKQLTEIIDIFSKYPEIETATLFGSRAIDTYKEASDVDIAIQGKQVDVFFAAKLKDHFEEETYLPFFFDVVAYDSITSEELKGHIRTKGVVIYRKGVDEWKECKLGDVVNLKRGHDLPERLRKEGKIPIYSSSGISGFHNESKVDEIGVVTGRYGTIGKLFLAKRPFWPLKTTFYVENFKGNDKVFIFYFLQQIDWEKFNDKSAVPGVNRNDAHKEDVSLPPLPEQKAIASVLSSLDDKIDLLHRQNKTLEAMAETLFRQWFVEEAQEDWEKVSLEDVTIRITDGAHKSPSTVETGLPMASVKDVYQWGINTKTCQHISQKDFNELTKEDCRPLKNDILIAKDGRYLKHIFVAEEDVDVVILSSIAILRPNGKYHPILLATFLKLESTKEGLENIVTGGVIPRIVLKDVRKFKLVLPPKVIQEQALVCIQPLYEKCWEHNRQIQTLEKLRDTLLPKLMSGEVRVDS